MKKIFYIFLLIFVCMNNLVQAQAETPNPESIIKKTIAAHGSEEHFKSIRDIYAKLLLKAYTKDGVFENTLYEYYRVPNLLRMDIAPNAGESVSISWDGESMHRYANNEQEKSQDKEDIEQMQESLRFMKLLILTNLLEKGSTVKYEQYQAKKNIHVISQTDEKGEKVWLLIAGDTYLLAGARFTIANDTTPYNVIFVQHHKFSQLVLPREARLFKGKELILEAKINLAKTNIIENKNNFFTDLTQKPILKKETRRHYRN